MLTSQKKKQVTKFYTCAHVLCHIIGDFDKSSKLTKDGMAGGDQKLEKNEVDG